MRTHTLDKRLLHVKEAAAELAFTRRRCGERSTTASLMRCAPGRGGRFRVSRDALERFLRPVTHENGDTR